MVFLILGFKLIDDENFHINVVTKAQEEVEHYGFDQCRDRFLKMIGEIDDSQSDGTENNGVGEEQVFEPELIG